MTDHRERARSYRQSAAAVVTQAKDLYDQYPIIQQSLNACWLTKDNVASIVRH
jgi:hypothetical protein